MDNVDKALDLEKKWLDKNMTAKDREKMKYDLYLTPKKCGKNS